MIPQLLELVRGRGQGDVVAKFDETLSLTFERGRLVSSSVAIERGTNLRIIADGRTGVSGTTGDDAEAMVEAALNAARAGEGGLSPAGAEPVASGRDPGPPCRRRLP